MIQILHEPTSAEPFLVLDKPQGLPSAPLKAGDRCALSEAIALFPELSCVTGRKSIEAGLVHRIDTATRGCVLIASTQESYDALLLSQKNGCFEKWYTARCDCIPDSALLLGGFPLKPAEVPASVSAAAASALEASFSVTSRFRPFGAHQAAVRPVTGLSGEAALKKSGTTLYQTDIALSVSGSLATALCHITAGYRHQVRCHLSWCGFPVQGDALYNPRCASADRGAQAALPEPVEMPLLAFYASRIRFPNPADGTIIDIALPDFAPV